MVPLLHESLTDKKIFLHLILHFHYLGCWGFFFKKKITIVVEIKQLHTPFHPLYIATYTFFMMSDII